MSRRKATARRRFGSCLENEVAESNVTWLRALGDVVTTVDGLLGVAVLIGLGLNSVFGWWWADPLAAYVLVYYAAKEARHIFRELNTHSKILA